ncbi:unnamed protein product, partial [Prorocentrum cordatum]
GAARAPLAPTLPAPRRVRAPRANGLAASGLRRSGRVQPAAPRVRRARRAAPGLAFRSLDGISLTLQPGPASGLVQAWSAEHLDWALAASARVRLWAAAAPRGDRPGSSTPRPPGERVRVESTRMVRTGNFPKGPRAATPHGKDGQFSPRAAPPAPPLARSARQGGESSADQKNPRGALKFDVYGVVSSST